MVWYGILGFNVPLDTVSHMADARDCKGSSRPVQRVGDPALCNQIRCGNRWERKACFRESTTPLHIAVMRRAVCQRWPSFFFTLQLSESLIFGMQCALLVYSFFDILFI